MSVFDRLDRTTSRVVDRAYAASFECHPGKTTANGRMGPDPDREAWTGKGVLVESPIMDAIETGNRNRVGNDLRTLASGNAIELSVDCLRYPGARTARQRDRIQMDDLRRFEIVSVKPDGLSRTVLQLLEIEGGQ